MGTTHGKHTFVQNERIVGNQPEGHMTWVYTKKHLPGYPRYGTIEMFFEFEDGIQTEKHPNPGEKYYGQNIKAYLPDNGHGRKVVTQLKKAFDQKLVFTVATNNSGEDAVALSDIPLKTRDDTSGPSSLCYPDTLYLKKVNQILISKHIE
ncbi:E3 ubiquitin-protein ligase DTX3L [Anguilla anguilla]|uniref:E3 ubiquitin-protein ligase DTX3L n=1 Tax=Anguilla anguilla TaxID=7936 RepID=UPI0015A88F2A|nr:E3 ubiquitin-protein ligase DTX3L [Anguilla anguilla]